MAQSIYDVQVTDIQGKQQTMAQYQGKVLLIVNTASKCGFTPQYQELETLYNALQPKGLEILGFPCNQFGHQEPGSDSDISQFCQLNYGVSFPMFAKIDVNGANTHPLYQLLKREAKGLLGSQGIKWNFTKFLVDKEGHVIERYAPTTKPLQLKQTIEQLL
ncbi:glutathione peroxidase [Shewanella avicenniae]|uniref:Glutathione peroxidase n=1 Tax=Shewanella avicenniae TaxID=2814294 RepID=A0ABX7QTU0_9GAMM|nr:glutathione peroxidase [Shewanella avicenniae]QSX34258.1 glutathione peroxidase [Shewanella avicenniae]